MALKLYVSQALIDMEISYEEFVTILKERDKFEKLKEHLKNVNENMRLNNANSKKKTSLWIIFTTCDFNCLKTCELNNKLSKKRSEIIKHLCHKKILYFLCVRKMSSEAKRLAKERKITAETYSKTETHTVSVYRKFADEDYVIWVKMIDLRKRLCHRNL